MKYGKAISIYDLKENFEKNEYLKKNFITLEKYFEKFDELVLDEKKLEMFLNGVKLNINLEDGIYKINCKNKIIGTGVVENNKLKRDIIL